MARKKKKSKKDQEQQKLFYLFYTQERFDNWVTMLTECSFEEGPESEEMPEGLRTLQNFTDDINIEVLKIIRLYQNERFGADEALKKLDEVEEIIMAEPNAAEIRDVIEGVQMRFLVLFLACKKFLKGDFSGDIKTLVKDGRKLVENNPEEALQIAGNIGALVINGESCCGKYLRGDLDEPDMFDDWLIEIDDMGNALKSLKKFDEEPGETS
jgi:hypothetical protein